MQPAPKPHHFLEQPKQGPGRSQGWRAVGGAPCNFPLLPGLLVLLASTAVLPAQPTPAAAPAQLDPLMSLMLSQPPIDVSSPVGATTSFEPPVVKPGQDAVYRVTFNALEESVDWPAKLQAPTGLEVRAGAHGHVLVFGGATMQPRTTFNYHIRPSSTGRFIIPGFPVTVYGKPVPVPPALLEVADSPPPSVPPAPRLILKLATTNLYVGQALRANIITPPGAGPVSQGAVPLQIAGDGLLVDQSSYRQHYETRSRPPGVVVLSSSSYELMVTPIRAGRLSAFAQGFFVSRTAGPLVISGAGAVSGSWSPYTLLDSDPVEIQVRPLPREGQLPGFTGAVGAFGVEGPELSTNLVRVGDPVKLRVRVHGDGNLARLVPPPPPHSPDWQVFVSPPNNAVPQVPQALGYATFEFTLIPLTRDVHASPAIPYSCFDPTTGAYQDLTIPPATLQVLPGPAPGDLQAVAQANATLVSPEKEPVLSGLAPAPGVSVASLAPLQLRSWYPLLQLAPAGAFLGLWSWDRRRRFLEQHPEIVRRRRARRALGLERRALERAVRSGNAPEFAAHAVSAMRIAAAPHYPAEPRALVGADVLALLGESERAGRTGEVVRRFFSVTDATRFAAEPAAAGELLALQSDLDQVLRQLEERL